jgi:hypothetical protein
MKIVHYNSLHKTQRTKGSSVMNNA